MEGSFEGVKLSGWKGLCAVQAWQQASVTTSERATPHRKAYFLRSKSI